MLRGGRIQQSTPGRKVMGQGLREEEGCARVSSLGRRLMESGAQRRGTMQVWAPWGGGWWSRGLRDDLGGIWVYGPWRQHMSGCWSGFMSWDRNKQKLEILWIVKTEGSPQSEVRKSRRGSASSSASVGASHLLYTKIVLFHCCGLIAVNERVPDRFCHGPTNAEKKAEVFLRLTTCRKQWGIVAVIQMSCSKVTNMEKVNNYGVSFMLFMLA